ARNQADALVQSVRKSLTEHGDKVDAGQKEKIEAAAKDVEEALKGEDKDAIEAKTKALAEASQKLGEAIYADAQAKAQQSDAGAGAAPGAQEPPAGAAGAAKDDGNVVDAEFTEVKDKKSA